MQVPGRQGSQEGVNVGLSAHSMFLPLPHLQTRLQPYPELPRCTGVRNEEAKGMERLGGVIKGSRELGTKTYQDEPCFMWLFIQALKYMTWKWEI